MPKVPGCRAKFAKNEVFMQYFRANNAILQEMGVASTFSDLKKMEENMQPKSNESGYKITTLNN
jgi:hypothetical protein